MRATLQNLTKRVTDILAAPGRLAWLIAGYVTLQFALRLVLMPGASQDDAEQLIVAQTLAGGYTPAQPPLYTWLVVASQALFGPGVFAVVFVKYLCQLATLGFVWLAARRATGDARLAAAATLGLLAVYSFAWEMLYNYSHTALWAAATAATVHAILRLRDAYSEAEKARRSGSPRPAAARSAGDGPRPSVIARSAGDEATQGPAPSRANTDPAPPGSPRSARDDDPAVLWSHVYLGAAIGVGLLAKYGYAVFLGGLVIACLAVPSYRRALIDWRIAATLAVIAIVTAPHLLWLAGGTVDLSAMMQARLTVDVEPGYWRGVGNALSKLVNALISFFFPLWLIVLAVFPRAFRKRLGDARPARRMLGCAVLATLAIVVAGFLAAGVTTFRTHYAVMVLPALVVWAFLRIRAAGPNDRALGRYALAVAATTLVFLLGVPVKAVVEPQMCSNCYYNMPYGRLAAEMRQAGFERGTVIAHFWRIQIGGNLKAEFPDSRVVSTKYPTAVPPPPEGAGQEDADQCLLVWDPRADEAPPPDLLRFAREVVGADLPDTLAPQIAEARMAWAVSRPARLAYAVADGGC